QTQSQKALGTDEGGTCLELLSRLPQSQPCGRIGTPELVQMQELHPFALAGLPQGLRGREDFDKGPSKGLGPVVKAFQRQGIVFSQGGQELINQRRTLFNQPNFITAEQP